MPTYPAGFTMLADCPDRPDLEPTTPLHHPDARDELVGAT